MNTVRFITIDEDIATVWCTTNTVEMFRDFIQFTLDGCPTPERYIIWDIEADKKYNLLEVANNLHMRPRTFDEKSNNVQTGVFAIIDI